MSTMKLIVIAVLLGTLAWLSPDAYGRLRQLETRNLLSREGLLTTTVNDLAQDSRGYIWMATPYGLYRHDGVLVWSYFEDGDSSGISTNLIKRIDADKVSGQVWIGTYYSGLCVFDCATETFRKFRHSDQDASSLSGDKINDVHVDDAGRVWISTDRGVDLYDPSRGCFLHYNGNSCKGLPSSGISRVRSIGDDLWIGHFHSGLYRLNLRTGAVTNYRHRDGDARSLSSDAVHSLCDGGGGRLLVGTAAGLSVMDVDAERFINFAASETARRLFGSLILDVLRASDGQIWCATPSNVCFFHESDIESIADGRAEVDVTYIRDHEWGIANPSVYSLLEDRDGNVWAGSNGGGASLFCREGGMFGAWRIDKVAGVTNGLNDKEVLALCLSEDERSVVMGTDGGGVNVNVDGLNCLFFTPSNSGLKSSSYQCALRMPDGRFLLSSAMGLEMLDIASGKTERMASLRFDYPSSMAVDADGMVWVGYNGGCIDVVDSDWRRVRELSGSNSGLPKVGINALFSDSGGNMWIGTFGFGLYVMDAVTGEINKPDFFDRRCIVNHIIEDRDSNLWIATDVGLACVSGADRALKFYDERDGMQCSSVFSVIEDGAGNIWMSTNVGITCFEREEGKFRNFGPADGVLPGPYLRHSCARKSDGTILMGGMNGVCLINERGLKLAERVPQPTFTSFTVLGHDRRAADMRLPVGDGNVELESGQNTFSVTFSPMDKSIVDRCLYAYRMKGLSDDWISIGHESKVTFHNLPAGRYSLQVRSKLANQEWPDGFSSLEVKIRPPAWLSGWAICVYVMIAVAAACAVTMFRRHLMFLHKRHHEMEAEVTKSKTLRQALIDDSLGEKDREFVETLIKVVEERIEDEKLDVGEISKHMGMSYSSLYRRVKSVTGSTVSDFIKRVRVHKAERLMLTGRYAVSEIAGMVGLSSVSYFRECFKREYGMSPTQWVKQIKGVGPAQDSPTGPDGEEGAR